MNYFAHLSNLDISIFIAVIAFTVLCLIIPILFKSKKNESVVDYMLMGRKLTLPIFVATLVATWYSQILGVTQIAFEKGVYNLVTQGVFWYLAALFFALFLVKNARSKNALTFPDLIKNVFGEKSAKLTSLIMLLNVLPVSSAIGIGIFLRGAFGFELNSAIMIGTALVGFYCVFGGFKSVVICDTIQFVLMYASIIMVAVISYQTFGGLEYLKANLPQTHFSPKANESYSTIFVWFFMAICWTLLSPIFYHRSLAAKDYKTAKYGIIISIVFWFICDIFTTLGGMYAKAHLGDAIPSEGYILYSLKILPEGFKGLFLASIICTVFSALDSALLIASSVLFHDLPKNSKAESKFYRLISMVLIVLITVVTSSFFGDSIESSMLTMQSIFMSVLLIPIVFGLLFRMSITDTQFVTLASTNLVISIAWTIFGMNEYINVFYIGSSINLLGITLFSYLAKSKLFSRV